MKQKNWVHSSIVKGKNGSAREPKNICLLDGLSHRMNGAEEILKEEKR